MPFGRTNIVHNRFFHGDDNFDIKSLSSWSGESYKIENLRESKTTIETNNDNAEMPDPGSVRTAAIKEFDIDSDKIADKNDVEED